MQKLILVILDGLGYTQARRLLGNIEGWVASGEARVWKMRATLPTTSGPCYASIHTGLPPQQHGILSNQHLFRIDQPDIFSAARQSGRRTGAVAHSFFSSYFQHHPFDPLLDLECDDDSRSIQHARFYTMEGESHGNPAVPSDFDLLALTTSLTRRFDLDYLLVHLSSPDSIGHRYGQQSIEMEKNTYLVDGALARYLPMWRSEGYQVLITADHGQNERGHHGGTEDVMREVPLYYFGDAAGPGDEETLDQLQLAPTVLQCLGVAAPDSMQSPAFLSQPPDSC